MCVRSGQADKEGSCQRPAAKRPKTEGEGDGEQSLLGAGLERESDHQQDSSVPPGGEDHQQDYSVPPGGEDHQQDSSVPPGGEACLVAWTTLPAEHQQMSG